MKLKRNLYIIIISIIIYFSLTICYEKFVVKDNFSYVYSLCRDVSRGEKISERDFNLIKVSDDSENKYLSLDKIDGYYNADFIEGTIMLNKMILSSNEYMKTDTNKEIISLKLNNAEDAASYQIEKNGIVNIFCSAKLNEIETIYNNINKESIMSNRYESGYVTIKLLEKVEIINCFDKYGKIVNKGDIVETILIQVSKEDSIKINSLKNYGKFSVSIVR